MDVECFTANTEQQPARYKKKKKKVSRKTSRYVRLQKYDFRVNFKIKFIKEKVKGAEIGRRGESL